MAKVAVLGYGNIGSGVVTVLLENKEVIAARAGEEIEPVCVLDLREFPGDVMEKKVVHDIEEITSNPEISIVVETMGGTKPAYQFVKACLLAGKHVATSNKELVAAHGAELLAIAKEKQVNFLFEASVGGAIPIIRPLSTCMTGDSIDEITGILNGTTNFMLTGMDKEGYAYDDILRKAQELGFAERDPSADVEGKDACRKIAILSSMAFGKSVDYNEIDTEGITKITDADMAFARELGLSIKLFGTSKKEDGQIYAQVGPVAIGANHPLFAVNGVMNAILVRGRMMGDLMYYGAGAGKLPTASAVVADVVAAVKNPKGGEVLSYSSEKQTLGDVKKQEQCWFVRLSTEATEEVNQALKVQKTAVIPGRNGYAVTTSEMTCLELEELAAKYPIEQYIRIAK